MAEKYLNCPFCKKTKRGRAKSYPYYEYLDHLTEEHRSDNAKVSGDAIWADELKALVRRLGDLGVIKK